MAWTNQDRAAVAALPRAAVVFKRQNLMMAQFAVRKGIGLCSESTVVSFPVYEHRGNTKKCIRVFIPAGMKWFCVSTPLKGAVILTAVPWFLFHLFSGACLSPQHCFESIGVSSLYFKLG